MSYEKQTNLTVIFIRRSNFSSTPRITDLNPLPYVQNNHNSMVMLQIEDIEVANVLTH